MPHLQHGAMGSFGFPAALTLFVAVTALIYVRGWLRLRPAFLHMVPTWRAASFLSGLFLIWAALASPIASLDAQLLTVHMIQHLLLMTFAPPLIWLGSPVRPLRQGLPQFAQAAVDQSFQWPPLQRLGKAVAQPTFCWLAACAVLVAWHIPAFFVLGMRSEAWHLFEQASFLVTGLLFWWPVIQPWPSVSKLPELTIILYLFFATLPCDILSGFLVFCDRVVYPIYFSASQPVGFSALEDQQCAGALMWTCVTVVYLVAGTILTTRLLSPQRSREDELFQSELSGGTLQEEIPQRLEAV